MGRRRRNQDTTQVGDIDQAFDSQDNQLQSVPVSQETLNDPSEIKSSSVKQNEETPYDERPIPEAYFPPEEEASQEFMPVPNIQKTPIPSYKEILKRELDALKFDVKKVEPAKAETKAEVKATPVETKNIDFSSFKFGVKPAQNTVADSTKSTNNVVATKSVDIPNIKIDVDKFISNSEASKANRDSFWTNNPLSRVDSLTASNDSLAKDSLAFIPVEQPVQKREIIKVDGKELPETINNTWWFTPVLILLFIAYSVIIRDRKKAIFSEMQSFIKPTTDGSIFGFQWLQNSKYKFFLSALGIISVSLYLFLANTMSIASIWMFILAVMIFVVGKNTMLSLLEYIYFQGADVPRMSEAFMVMVRQAGLMITPAVLGLCFAPETYRTFFIYFGVIVIGIAILAFNIKLILNFLRGITSIFYLILYLCTLEVIPVAIFFVLGLLPRL